MVNTKQTPVQPMLVQAYCSCGGELISTGARKATAPPQNAHHCNQCGRVEWILDEVYPTIEYQQLEFDFMEDDDGCCREG